MADRPDAVRRDHFAQLVSDWSHFGAPLRPSAFDTAVIAALATRLPAAARVLVLGLTPETVACPWPEATTLLALDHSPAMVAALWPTAGAPATSAAVLADWLHLPVGTRSCDMVCADGCHTQLEFPQGHAALATEVARVLRPGGVLAARVFIRPDSPEPLEAIAAAMAEGRIGSVHALKLRLLAALHGASGRGTYLDDVWQAWRRLPASPLRQAQATGWRDAEVQGIEAYRGLATRYELPTLAELRAIHVAEFTERALQVGSYEGSGQCPTLVLARR